MMSIYCSIIMYVSNTQFMYLLIVRYKAAVKANLVSVVFILNLDMLGRL
jgi:hypothetical protein